MSRILKIIGVVLVIIALGYSLRGGFAKHPKERSFTVNMENDSSELPTTTREWHKMSDDVDNEPTAYETRPVIESVDASETTVAESSIAYTEPANDGTDTELPTGAVIDVTNYQYVFKSILVDSPVIYNDFKEAFTDNFLANVDKFQETNPLRRHMDMNEWVEGDLTTDEFVIRIIDEADYRFRYTMVDGKLDSIEYVGEE